MHAMRHEFDAALVDSARAGDEQAVNRVLVRLEEIFRRFFISRIGRCDEVDDLVQNSLVRVHTSLADLKDSSSLRSFAMKAAFFELQDLYRGRYSGKEATFDPLAAPDSAKEEDGAARIDVERALGHLSDHARRILELREYGYRYEEIAKRLDTTEAAVKMQVKRAFEKLREVLAMILLIFT